MPSKQPWLPCRTVVLDDEAEAFVRAQEHQGSRFEDQWQGIEWLLARKPEYGSSRFPEEPCSYLVYVFPGDDLASTQELWVLYSYDQNEVVIHSVKFGT